MVGAIQFNAHAQVNAREGSIRNYYWMIEWCVSIHECNVRAHIHTTQPLLGWYIRVRALIPIHAFTFTPGNIHPPAGWMHAGITNKLMVLIFVHTRAYIPPWPCYGDTHTRVHTITLNMQFAIGQCICAYAHTPPFAGCVCVSIPRFTFTPAYIHPPLLGNIYSRHY